MGKGKKRKNPGVGVDFRKVKHKVGKKLPKAQNETSTDFQARSINLPNQSITQDKAGAAVSERNLTLKELLSQLSHHNASTRRDALTGLQQLLAAHPAEARRHPAPLLEALAPRLSDGEASVRSTLLTTLRGAVLPALGPAALSPFLPLLLAHVSAALTNLSADVRFDALAALEALTQAAPALMGAGGALGCGLGHYAGLLSRANRGKSVKSQALAGLLKVVASLDRFLTLALPTAGSSSSSNSTTTPSAAAAAAADDSDSAAEGRPLLLQGQRAAAAPPAAATVPPASLLLQLYCPGVSSTAAAGSTGRPSSGGKGHKQGTPGASSSPAAAAGAGASGDGVSTPGSSGNSSSSRPLQEEVLALLEVLFECWAEAAPGSLSSAPEAEASQVLLHILSAAHTLISHFSPAASTAATTTNSSSSYAPALAAAAAATGSSSNLSSPGIAGSAAGAAGVASAALCPGFNTSRDQAAWLQQAACIVLPRLSKVFPVAPPASRGLAPALSDLLQRLNLLGMQLSAGFMAAGVVWPPQQQRGQRRREQQQQQQAEGQQGAVAVAEQQQQQQEWQQRLLVFMTGVLAAGNCLPHLETAAAAAGGGRSTPGSSSSKAQQQQQQPAPSTSSSLSSSSILVAVLQTLQLLLPQLTGPARRHILAAVTQLAAAAAGGGGAGGSAATAAGAAGMVVDGVALPPLSAAAAGAAVSNSARTACLRLQLLLLQQHLWAAGTPSPSSAEEAAAMAGWLAAAPKLLYELGASKPRISALLLQLLFEAARLSGPAGGGSDGSAGLLQQQLHQLQPQLAALLVTQLPPQASKQQAGAPAAAGAGAGAQQQVARVLVGPLSELPPSCQHLAFDTLAHLPSLTPALLKSVALTCRVSSYRDPSVQRLLDGLLAAAAGGGSMAPDVYTSFVATLLSPGPPGGYLDRGRRQQVGAGFGRHQLVVDVAARWLHCYGPLQELLLLLARPLLLQWEQQQAQEQPQEQVCCLTYSLSTLAALAAGCWVPSSGAGSSMVGAAAVSEACVPLELLCVLPTVLATHCLQRAAAAAAAGGGDGSSGLDASTAAVDSCLQQLVLPLATTLPSSSLLMPFLQQLVQQGLAQQQQQMGAGGVLGVVVHVLRVLLGHQGLRLVWVQQEAEVGRLLQQLQGAAQRLQAQSGDGGALSGVEQLQTALEVVCKR